MISINRYDTISIVRGDTADIDVNLSNYKLQEGDSIIFTISNDEKIILQKEITTFNEELGALIHLDSTETLLLDTEKTYRYDIQFKNSTITDTLVISEFKTIKGVTNENL